ncbi:MAG: hypothetical protein Q8P67_15410 [archaeon]|nr:hypothetical protein [archaeon]
MATFSSKPGRATPHFPRPLSPRHAPSSSSSTTAVSGHESPLAPPAAPLPLGLSSPGSSSRLELRVQVLSARLNDVNEELFKTTTELQMLIEQLEGERREKSRLQASLRSQGDQMEQLKQELVTSQHDLQAQEARHQQARRNLLALSREHRGEVSKYQEEIARLLSQHHSPAPPPPPRSLIQVKQAASASASVQCEACVLGSAWKQRSKQLTQALHDRDQAIVELQELLEIARSELSSLRSQLSELPPSDTHSLQNELAGLPSPSSLSSGISSGVPCPSTDDWFCSPTPLHQMRDALQSELPVDSSSSTQSSIIESSSSISILSNSYSSISSASSFDHRLLQIGASSFYIIPLMVWCLGHLQCRAHR